MLAELALINTVFVTGAWTVMVIGALFTTVVVRHVALLDI
jgi:hypothetical protein